MTAYRRKLMAAVMIGFVSMGSAFAQKGKGERPPKPDSKVRVEKKGEKPPPNSNQGDKRGGRRERPGFE